MKKIIILFLFSCAMPFLLMSEQLPSSEFLKGYIHSKLEDRFPYGPIEVDVAGTNIIVYRWPVHEYGVIKCYLENLCPNYNIQFNSFYQPGYTFSTQEVEPFEEGGFLPELNPFFPTMLAQPHILGYSVGYRSYDKVFKSSIPVSIGDQFSFYQFKINPSAKLYLGIEACVWAIFEAKTKTLSLINADYYVAFPITYIADKFSARLRMFHQSSHLGDEFLLENPKVKRVNPSMEGLDLSLAYEPIDRFTAFAGYSRVLRCDKSFKVKPSSVYYGFNYFFDFAKIQTFHVEGIPYIATYFVNREDNHWALDSSLAIGYQWDKYYGRKLRIYLAGHDGYSSEGQFARHKSKYVSLNLLYGY